jgi:hypothetical protein
MRRRVRCHCYLQAAVNSINYIACNCYFQVRPLGYRPLSLWGIIYFCFSHHFRHRGEALVAVTSTVTPPPEETLEDVIFGLVAPRIALAGASYVCH